MLKTAVAALLVLLGATANGVADNDTAFDLSYEISKFFYDPAISGHGIANDDGERYHHSITLQWTGKERDAVETQLRTTAEVAKRAGQFVLDKGFRPPGEHLIIKMALKDRKEGFTNT